MEEPSLLPMVKLIVTPSEYGGTHILVIGFLVFNDREQILYASRDDALHAVLSNGVAIDLPPNHAQRARLLSLSGGYVMIKGRFEAPPSASQRLTSGSLVDVDGAMDETTWSRDEGSRFEPR